MKEIPQQSELQLQTVKKVFTDFLSANGHKKTSERMAILEEIYCLDNHFDAGELHHCLRLKNYTVSMATVYNNMKLFEQAGLITKHRFENGMAQYERCYFRGNHHHIIFTDTGEVREFKDGRISEIQKMIEETYGIVVDRHSLYFYGRHCKQNRKDSSPVSNDSQVL
ncbi:MAG: transcriptional repressor [Bacteroidota bacterium]